MSALRVFKTFRLLLLVIVGVSIGLIVGSVYHLNQSGLNHQWRAKIAAELENLGIIADFESLRLDISKGLIAEGVRVYTDDQRDQVFASLEHLVIDVDKTKLMRGILRVNNVALKQADISLPIDAEDPESKKITINDLSGEIFLPNKTKVEARDLTGNILGIKIDINAHGWASQQQDTGEEMSDEAKRARTAMITGILEEIDQWQWNNDQAPELKIFFEGDIHAPDTTRLNFKLTAKEVERNGANLTDVSLKGDIKNKTITLEQISLSNGPGKLSGHADFYPELGTGKFEIDSTVHLQLLARRLFNIDILSPVTFSTSPEIHCDGTITFTKNNKPHLQAKGNANLSDFSLLGTHFKKLKTDFSTKGKDLFLTGLTATHSEGSLQGRVLIKDDTIRYQAESSLPSSVYSPFIAHSNIKKTLSKAIFSPESDIDLSVEGTINRNDLSDWSATGKAKIANFKYNTVPLLELSGDFVINSSSSTFSDISALFDYSNYLFKQKYGGVTTGEVKADKVSVIPKEKIVSIDNVRGTAWPAPVVTLFSPSICKHIETYQFNSPPILKGNGTFDLIPGENKTDFTVDVKSAGKINYSFLGQNLSLYGISSQVHILSDRVHVNNLKFNTFNGPCSGKVTVYTSGKQNGKYKGAMQWQRIHLKDIGQLYRFNNADQGLITGRIDFNGAGQNIRTFNASGSMALENGNLFSVPMLGPISPLVSTVLGKRNPSEQTAKNASFSYIIKNGVLYSNDFLASTPSLSFTGEGKIDLEKKQIDMLMRMNARGVFGFIIIPLKPFIGLFQFQGSGSFSDPVWKTVIFTNPKKGKDDPIFRKPPKAKVLSE